MTSMILGYLIWPQRNGRRLNLINRENRWRENLPRPLLITIDFILLEDASISIKVSLLPIILILAHFQNQATKIVYSGFRHNLKEKSLFQDGDMFRSVKMIRCIFMEGEIIVKICRTWFRLTYLLKFVSIGVLMVKSLKEGEGHQFACVIIHYSSFLDLMEPISKISSSLVFQTYKKNIYPSIIREDKYFKRYFCLKILKKIRLNFRKKYFTWTERSIIKLTII